MSAEDVIKRIEDELAGKRKDLARKMYNEEGLLRLQKTMAAYGGEFKLIWSDEILKRLQDKKEVKTHGTGMLKFDEVTGGFREQQLITIGGDTGHGKTAMGIFMLNCFEKLNPIYLALEQSAEEIIDQLRGNRYLIPKFLTPEVLPSAVTVNWIEERIVEGIAKHNSRLAVIDHLGYINDMPEQFRRENLAYRIGQVMKGLKGLAKKWNAIIVLLAHISQHDEDRPPSRTDIKNSSDIVQESDMVILLWRKNSVKNKVRVYQNKTMLSIQKNRRTGKNATVGLDFDTSTGMFKESVDGWVESMVQAAQQAQLVEDSYDEL